MAAKRKTWTETDNTSAATAGARFLRFQSGSFDLTQGLDDTGTAFMANDAQAVPHLQHPPVPQPAMADGRDRLSIPQAPASTLKPAAPLPEALSPLPMPTVSRNRGGSTQGGEDGFLLAIEEDLREIRNRAAHMSAEPLPALPAVPVAPTPRKPSDPPVLDLAHPLHAELQDARRSIRGMWVGLLLLIAAVVAGVVWTTVRFDRYDRLIVQLLEQLDGERVMVQTYKQDMARLYEKMNDAQAERAKQQSREQAQREHQNATWGPKR